MHRFPVQIPSQLQPVLDALAPGAQPPEQRLAAARKQHPGLDRILGALAGTSVQPTILESPAPQNVVPSEATLTLTCVVLPGTTADELERELRNPLGEGDYELQLTPPKGGSISDENSPLRDAIEAFLADADPDARLIPALAYGYSDCHVVREAYGSLTYGFIPFRHADPMTNLKTKHGADEHVLVDDLLFQTQATISIARHVGTLEH